MKKSILLIMTLFCINLYSQECDFRYIVNVSFYSIDKIKKQEIHNYNSFLIINNDTIKTEFETYYNIKNLDSTKVDIMIDYNEFNQTFCLNEYLTKTKLTLSDTIFISIGLRTKKITPNLKIFYDVGDCSFGGEEFIFDDKKKNNILNISRYKPIIEGIGYKFE